MHTEQKGKNHFQHKLLQVEAFLRHYAEIQLVLHHLNFIFCTDHGQYKHIESPLFVVCMSAYTHIHTLTGIPLGLLSVSGCTHTY